MKRKTFIILITSFIILGIVFGVLIFYQPQPTYDFGVFSIEKIYLDSFSEVVDNQPFLLCNFDNKCVIAGSLE